MIDVAALEHCRTFINCQIEPARAGEHLPSLPIRSAVTMSRQAGCGALVVAQKLAALLQRGRRILHTFTQEAPAGWTGFLGRIDSQMLSATIPEFSAPLFYICGPPAMCDDVARHLLQFGAARSNIRLEKYD